MISIAKPLIGEAEISRVVDVLRSGQLAFGPVVEEFERALAQYAGFKHAVATTNGTTALHTAMAALGVTRGDEVVVPDFTFIATANAPRFVGAKPSFVDVDSKTFNISPEAVRTAITPKTKAVIAVSLYGQPYDVEAMLAIAREKNIRLVSDNAQAIGAKWKGKRNFGEDCAVLSFYATKNAVTGEGGAVLTDDDELAQRCREFRNHGQGAQYEYRSFGHNFRLTSVLAAIGIEQLKRVDEFNAARRKNAALYNELLAPVAEKNKIELPFEDERCFHVYNQYTIKVKHNKRDALREFLKQKQIGTGVYYPAPLHSLPPFSARAKTPLTKRLCKEVLSLPVHPALNESDLQTVAVAVKDFFKIN
ncbi:MAG: DegT/DnrJ/EryC1/StrS family aminotransferase [Candidatus Norongarragalinales archaeon]